MKTIEETFLFIQEVHAGQTDKAGKPYWLHPVAVMHRLGLDATHVEKIAALLHDVIEDTDLTWPELVTLGFPRDAVMAVSILSRPKGPNRKDYLDWIRSIAASGNRLAIKVKIADVEHNADPARVAKLPDGPLKAKIEAGRYVDALALLRAALTGLDGKST